MHGQELKEKSKSMKKVLFYYVLLFIISYSVFDYTTIICLFFNIQVEFSHITSLLIPIICLYIFLIIISCFVKYKVFKFILLLLLSVSIFSIIPEIIHIVVFNKPIDYISLMTLADTNKSEAGDFIQTYGNFTTYLKLFFIIICPYIVLLLLPEYKRKIKIYSWKFILVFVVTLTAFILTFPRDYVQRELKPVFIYKTYQQVIKDKKLFIESITNNKYEDYGDIIVNSISDNNTYVLVIGESSDRNRNSLYGYERNTAAYLSKIKNEIYIFDDVISPHAHTSPSLEKVLTFADFQNEDFKYKYGSIIDFFKSAGFKTFWLSNQYKYGDYDAGYTAIANAADEKVYINTNSWQSHKTNYYDEKLVEKLALVLKNTNGNRFIIVHLFGSHSPYAKRYPKEFNIYKSNVFLKNINPNSKYANEANYNAYDNSILYTDYVLYKIITLLKQENINGYMLYFSDHGEDAGTTDKNIFHGHNESISTKPMYEIPFILWLSEKYKKENKEKINYIQNSIHRPYQTDRVIHTVIDLSNMDNKLFKPEDSIINKKFQQQKRYYGSKEYKK